MSMTSALRAHLLTKTQITALCANRIFLGELSPDSEPLPHVAYVVDTPSGEANGWENTIDGALVDLQFINVFFEIRAESTSDLNDLSDLVRRALEIDLGTGATIGSEVIESLEIRGIDDDLPVQIVQGTNTIDVLRRIITCEVGYRWSTTPVT